MTGGQTDPSGRGDQRRRSAGAAGHEVFLRAEHAQPLPYQHRECRVLRLLLAGDNKELFAINVKNNRVTEKILRPADPRYLDYPPLPYELEIVRWEGQRRRRRRQQRQTAEVVDLTTGRVIQSRGAIASR